MYPPDPRYPNLPVPYGPPGRLVYSDKSKVAAGLLQLIPGFFSIGGIGRLYMGSTLLGVLQLVIGIVSWVSFWCMGFLFLPLFFPLACWVWFLVDGIVILTGNPRDGRGLPLRP